jgi:Domain of unknown function (DUF6259)
MFFLKYSIFSILLLNIIFSTHATPVKVAYAGCEIAGKGWQQPGSTKKRGSITWQKSAGHNGSMALLIKSVKPNNYFYNSTKVKLDSSKLEFTLWAKGDSSLKFHQMLYKNKMKYISQRGSISVIPEKVKLTSKWKEYKFKISIDDPQAKFMKIYLAPTKPGTIYIDDVKLYFDNNIPKQDIKKNKTTYVPAPAKLPIPKKVKNDFISFGNLFYRITLWKNGDYKQKKVIIGSKSELDKELSKIYPECKVKCTITDNPDGTHYKINVDAKAPYGVYEVEYPLFRITPISGQKYDRLLVPYQYGVVLDDPFNREERDNGGRPRLKKSIWYGVYGEKQQNMQMLIYDNGHQGAMLWTKDNNGWIKDFEVSRDLPEKYKSNALRLTVHHFPANTGQPGTSWNSPYPVVVTKFTDGWYNAIQNYKKWALQQKWCASGTIIERIERNELPKWYMNNPMWLTIIDHNMLYILKHYSRVLPDVDFGVFVTQWQRWAFDLKVPEFLPPKSQVGFQKIIDWQKKRMHFVPYMNVHLVDTNYKKMDNRFRKSYIKDPIPMKSIAPINGWTTPSQTEYWGRNLKKEAELKTELRKAWSAPVNETLLTKINSDWMGLYWWQRTQLIKKLRDNWGKDISIIDKLIIKNTLRPVCRIQKQWRDYWVDELASKLVKKYGSDGVYLDQLIVGGVYTCWSKKHSHDPGFGNYFLNGSRKIIENIRKKNPQVIMQMECTNEYLIDYINEGFVAFPNVWKAKSIPLFNSVYQGYFSMHEWFIMPSALKNLNNFAAIMAIPVHMGYKIGSFYTTSTHIELFKPKNKLALDYLLRLVKMKQQTMEVFAYGEKLKEPEVIDTPFHKILFFRDKKGKVSYPAVRPVVESSLWRSWENKGKVLLLLSNSGNKQQIVKVKADIKSGTRLTDLQGKSIIYSPENPIKIDKFSFRALMTE